MKKTSQINHTHSNKRTLNPPSGGLSVRTNLRAGLAWDDLDDKAKDIWSSLTSAVTNASNTLTSGGDASKPAA